MMQGVSVEPFRGDLGALHDMAVESWRDEYGVDSFPDLYAPAFVAWLTDGVAPDHAVAAYDGDDIVAFVCNVPRTVGVGDRRVRAVLSALLTCRKAYLRRGIAEEMIRSALTLNAEHGYDVAFFYLEAGHRSSRLFAKLAASGAHIVEVRTVMPWIRIFDVDMARRSENIPRYQAAALSLVGADRAPSAAAPRGLMRPYRPSDLQDCLALADAEAARCGVGRRFEADELAAFLDRPKVCETLVLDRDGHAAAFVAWMAHDHVGRVDPPATWAWIAHVAYGSLGARDRRRMVAAVCRRLHDAGLLGVVAWPMGGPTAPLLANRFVPYPRRVRLMAWILNPAPDLERELTGARRVFEVQI